jgi:hypothetical protein
VEVGNGKGNVAFTFPLRDAGLYSVPAGECEQEDRTGRCRSAYDTGPDALLPIALARQRYGSVIDRLAQIEARFVPQSVQMRTNRVHSAP